MIEEYRARSQPRRSLIDEFNERGLTQVTPGERATAAAVFDDDLSSTAEPAAPAGDFFRSPGTADPALQQRPAEASGLEPDRETDFNAATADELLRHRSPATDRGEFRVAERQAELEDRPAPENLLRGAAAGMAKGATRVPDIPLAITQKGAELAGYEIPVVDEARETIGDMQRHAEDTFDPQGVAGMVGTFAGELLPAAFTAQVGSRAVAGLITKYGSHTKLAQAIRAGREGSYLQRLLTTVTTNAPVDVAYGVSVTPKGENPLPAIGANLALSAGGTGILEGFRTPGVNRNRSLRGDLGRIDEGEAIARELDARRSDAAGRARGQSEAEFTSGQELTAAPPPVPEASSTSSPALGKPVPAPAAAQVPVSEPQKRGEIEHTSALDELDQRLDDAPGPPSEGPVGPVSPETAPAAGPERRYLDREAGLLERRQVYRPDPAPDPQASAPAAEGFPEKIARQRAEAGKPPITPRATPRNAERGAVRVARSDLADDLPAGVKQSYVRARSAIDFSGALASKADRLAAGSLSTRIQRLGDALANGQAPIERLGAKVEDALPPGRNPKYLLTRVKSGEATVRQAIREGVPDFTTREPTGPSYESLFERFGGDDRRIEQALTYAVQERAVGRGIKAFGGDQQAFDDAHAVVEHFRGNTEMQAFRTDLEAYTDALGKYAVDAELWTPKQWAAIKNSDALYIPFKRLMSATPPPEMRGPGKQLANVSSGVKSFTGSRRALHNPARALAEYTNGILRRADAYRVGHSLFDAADKLGAEGDLILTRITAPEGIGLPRSARQAAEGAGLSGDALEGIDDLFVPTLDPKNPVIWRNGPNGREYARVNAPDLYKAVAGLNAPRGVIEQFLDLTLRPMKRVFTAATTAFVPRFVGGTNPARDIPEAFAKTRNNLNPLDMARGIAEAIGGVAGVSKLAKEAERAGLGGVSMFGAPTNPKGIQRRFAPTTMGQRLRGQASRVTAGDRSLLAGAERLAEASDKAPRLAEYIAALRKTQPLVNAGLWSIHDQRLYAATSGRKVTLDFSDKPGAPVLRAFADYIPFAGPAMQSPVRWAQAIRNNPARMGAYVAAIGASSTLAWVLKHRSDQVLAETNDRPPEERGGFLLFPIDDQGNVTLRVPLSSEAAIIKSGVEAGLDAWLDENPDAAKPFIASLVRALPPGVGELAQGNLSVPIPLVQQLLENKANRRDYSDTPVIPERLQRLPTEEQRYDTTPETWSLVGRLLGVSPLKVQNAARGLLSQAEPLVTKATDPLARKALGAEAPVRVKQPLRSNPLNPLSTFVATNPPSHTASEKKYYELKGRIEKAKAALKVATDRGDESMLERLVSSGDAELLLDDQADDVLKAVDEALDELREEQNVVQQAAREGARPEAIRSELDRIRKERQEVYRTALGLLESAR